MTSHVTLSIPYSLLLHDNRRFMVSGKRLVLHPQYRRRKAAVRQLAVDHADSAALAPLSGPLLLVGTLHAPDRRKRDQRNYAKLVTDALSGVLYSDDAQLVAEMWCKGAPDRAAPHLTVSIYPIYHADLAFLVAERAIRHHADSEANA